MDLASACPLCGRAVGNTGYMVVERAYWYHDCGALGLAPGTPTQSGNHALAAAGAAPALPAGGRPTLVDSVFQPRSRLTISPAPDSTTIQRFCTALSAHPAVRDVELEQFIGQMAVLLVDATSLSDLITALLNVEQFPVNGLTVTPDGQLSARLDEQAIARAALPRRPAVEPIAPAQGAPRLNELQERVQRLARDLGALVARAPIATAVPSAPAAAPFEERPQPFAPAPFEPPSAIDSWPAPAMPSADEDLWTTPPANEDSWITPQPMVEEPWGEPLAAPSDGDTLATPLYAETVEAEADERPAVGAHVWQALDRLAALRQSATQQADTDSCDEEESAGREPLHLATATLPADADGAPAPASFFRHVAAAVESAGTAATLSAIATEPAEAATPRAPGTPQSIQVVAYPFENFSGVNSFINAVRLLPDVRYVAPRRFRAGTIQLAVDYMGDESLSERLRSLTTFTPRIVAEDDETVTVAIGGEN